MGLIFLIVMLYIGLWFSGIVAPPWAMFFPESKADEQHRKEITARFRKVNGVSTCYEHNSPCCCRCANR